MPSFELLLSPAKLWARARRQENAFHGWGPGLSSSSDDIRTQNHFPKGLAQKFDLHSFASFNLTGTLHNYIQVQMCSLIFNCGTSGDLLPKFLGYVDKFLAILGVDEELIKGRFLKLHK